jgi:hypothetical protein
MSKKSERWLMVLLGLGAIAAGVSFVSIVVLFGIALSGVFFG